MLAKAAWVLGYGTFEVGDVSDPIDPIGAKISYRNASPSDENSTNTALDAGKVSNANVVSQSVAVERFMNCATFANVAHITRNNDGRWQGRGDPTEIAIQVFASRFNWGRSRLLGQFDDESDGEWKCLAEFPFDSDVKRMSVIYERIRNNNDKWVFTKGALERVLPLCTHHLDADGKDVEGVTDELRRHIDSCVGALASQGLRVLTMASRKWTRGDIENYAHLDRRDVEQNLTFLGLIGLYDPPRIESAGAVEACGHAGIVVHMLTGDHPGTAEAIAKQVGIIPPDIGNLAGDVANSLVMTAMQFDKLNDNEIDVLPVLPRVIARCTPQTKVRMIEALHRRKRFAAMTGDGVNDSPSLVRADVGIAMVSPVVALNQDCVLRLMSSRGKREAMWQRKLLISS
jgi:potassium/sodium efflux P-type ATPase